MSDETPTPEAAPQKKGLNRLVTFVPLAVLAIILGFALSRLTSSDPAPASFSSPTRPAPEFNLPGYEGGQISLVSFKGRPFVVNFWATWCGPCQYEHPELMKMKAAGVEIVGILYKDPDGLEKAGKMLARNGNPFASIALDPEGRTGLDFGTTKLPESYLVDANGVIVKSMRIYFDPQDPKDAQDFIDAYKAEVAKAGAKP